MTRVRVRPFVRSDRDQVAALVNAHAAAVVPGSTVSVQALLGNLERDPGEFVVDPWVAERVTLVAEVSGRVAAATHLLRYASTEEVGPAYRGTAEIRWLLCWPEQPFAPGGPDAGEAVLAAALKVARDRGVRVVHGDGTLPVPGVYGVPEAWAHVHRLYAAAGFTGGRAEAILLALTEDLWRGLKPLPGTRLERTLGINGTRLLLVDEVSGADVGVVEVDTTLGEAGRYAGGASLADIGNLQVMGDPPDGPRVAQALLWEAAHWLHLGRVARLLAYVDEQEPEEGELLRAAGFTQVARTRRDLTLTR